MIFGKKKKIIEELKRENEELKSKIDYLENKLSYLYEDRQENEIKKERSVKVQENNDDEDITNIDVYIKKIAQAKSPQEIENLRAKRRLLMQVKRAEINRQRIDYSKVGRKKKYDYDNTEEDEEKIGGDNMDIEGIWRIYDNLNPIVKNLVKSYVKNKTGLDIEKLRDNPEQLLSLLNQFIASQKGTAQDQGQSQSKTELSVDELKKKADELEKEILSKRKD
jgi:hypothetical protein